ncbi:MAG: glycosyltransferase family 2 protein [Burkholderiales bacterium]|nr:glycosyltransferase family 2 protein [Burkholderiales bacterium]
MYQNKSVAVVVPAHNEETQIARVLTTMPDFVDSIVVIDDCSRDHTTEVVKEHAARDARIVPLRHEVNQGVGGSIATGYKWARDKGVDCAVVMAGDGQMDPADLPALLEPVVAGATDYAKGNRLITGEAFRTIPRARYFGNAILSLLTKIASGYWHVADSQTGYTVISRRALLAIDWDRMYKRYGQPNDLLVRLNVENMRVTDVPVRPVYRVGEKSGIRLYKVIFTIGWLLFRMFWWRMKEKYVIRDFHPLVFFYLFGCALMAGSALFAGHTLWLWSERGHVPEMSALAAMFMFASGMQSLFFAMWFDMEANRNLK